jgi:GTPase KRas protein
MGKPIRVVVAGGPSCGKTSMLERLIYNNYDPDKKMFPTQEDIYLGQIDVRNRMENLHIHDTSGEEWIKTASPPRHLCYYGEGFLLVYDITSEDSFNQIKKIKKEIEKELSKTSPTLPMCVAAMKCDMEEKVSSKLAFRKLSKLKQKRNRSVKYFDLSASR